MTLMLVVALKWLPGLTRPYPFFRPRHWSDPPENQPICVGCLRSWNQTYNSIYLKHIGDKTSRKTSSTLQHRSICLNTTNWLKICANLSISNGKPGLYLVLAHHVYPSTRISPDVTDPFQSYPQQVVLLCLNGHILSQFILHHSYIVRLSLPINFMTTCIS